MYQIISIHSTLIETVGLPYSRRISNSFGLPNLKSFLNILYNSETQLRNVYKKNIFK